MAVKLLIKTARYETESLPGWSADAQLNTGLSERCTDCCVITVNVPSCSLMHRASMTLHNTNRAEIKSLLLHVRPSSSSSAQSVRRALYTHRQWTQHRSNHTPLPVLKAQFNILAWKTFMCASHWGWCHVKICPPHIHQTAATVLD